MMSSEPVAATDLDPNKNGYFFPGRKHMTWTKQTKNLSRKLCLLILQISSEKNAGMKGVGGNINCGHEDLIRSSYLSHGINKVYQDVILRGCRFPPGQIGQTPWGSPEFMLYPAKISLILCKPHWSHILHRSGQIVVVFSPDSSRPFRFFPDHMMVKNHCLMEHDLLIFNASIHNFAGYHCPMIHVLYGYLDPDLCENLQFL